MTKQEYLKKNVFYGLTNLNNGFDAAGIKYYSERDFAIVLDRVKNLRLGVTGIEPWKNGNITALKFMKIIQRTQRTIIGI
jgi:hypothetical protein